jgi:NAD(P)-dependent dehydrogenase (short-subunit alcohol dehydrogenase family)
MLAADSAMSLLHALTGAMETTLEPLEAESRLTLRVSPDCKDNSKVEDDMVRRYVTAIQVAPTLPITEPPPAMPSDTLILTDNAQWSTELSANRSVVMIADKSVTESAYLSAVDGREIKHVRVVVSGGDGALMASLHTLCFLAVRAHGQALRNGGSYVILLMSAFKGGAPLPHVGLFTGLVKCLPWELPGCDSYALASDLTDLEQGLATLAREHVLPRRFPITWHRNGERTHPLLREAPCDARNDIKQRLGVMPVTVVTGGARGIVAEMALALAQTGPLRLWLLGSQALPDAADLADITMGRAALLEEWNRNDPHLAISDLNTRYERLIQAADKLRNLDRLRALCGCENVHYLVCDVTNGEAVELTVKQILAQDGPIDLLIHGAGLHRTSLRGDPVHVFERVRDVKVRGYLNLKQALAHRAPRIWCNVGSVAGYMGVPGDLDYASANDFLTTAASYHKSKGADEFTISWTMWKEAGFAAQPLFAAHMGRRQTLSAMSTQSALDHFLAEMSEPQTRAENSLYLGDAELYAMERFADRVVVAESSRGRYFIEDPGEPRGHGQWTVSIGLDRHPYLLDHIVDGRPCMPGAVFLEIAAEAAVALSPSMVVRAISNARFSQFLRGPRRWWPAVVRVAASIVSEAHQNVVVKVRIESDVTASDGAVLRPPRLHAEITVELGRGLSTNLAYDMPEPGRTVGRQVPDPYRLRGSPVCFDGSFLAVWGPREHLDGASAYLDLSRAARTKEFQHFLIPSVAIDSLARTRLFKCRDGKQLVAGFGAISRIDLHTTCNDADLARVFGTGIYLTHRVTSSGARSLMIAPDGRVLVEVFHVEPVERAEFDGATGTFLPIKPAVQLVATSQ